jgi:hypothetical protein
LFRRFSLIRNLILDAVLAIQPIWDAVLAQALLRARGRRAPLLQVCAILQGRGTLLPPLNNYRPPPIMFRCFSLIRNLILVVFMLQVCAVLQGRGTLLPPLNNYRPLQSYFVVFP